MAEYTRLAALARRSEDEPLARIFDQMAEQEQRHRDLFREMARGRGAVLPALT